MAQSEKLCCITRPAGADLSAAQYRFVELTSAGKVTQCNAQGELALGVLQNDPDADTRAAEVAIGGVTKVTLGATVAANAKVMTDTTGRAITATATNHVLGLCIKGGAVGEVGEVLLYTPSILA